MPFWNKETSKMKPATILKIGIGILVVFFAVVIYKIMTPDIDRGTYQLIRVESGESYVGKLTHANEGYVQLNDVYVYEAAGAEPKENSEQANDATDDNLTLIPVSSIKGTMYVSRDKIVYWGNLSNEGPVVNAINSNKNKSD